MRARVFSTFITVLLMLYYLLTVMNPRDRYAEIQSEGRIYPQICMLVVVLISLWIVFKHNIKNSVLSPFYIFIVLFWIYSLTSSVSFIDTFSYILKSTSGYVFALLFYYFFEKEEAYTIKISMLLMYTISIYGIFQYIQTREETIYGTFESPVGFIYSQLLPLILLWNKNKISPYLFIFSFVMCLMSGQRTASLLACLFCFPAFKVYRNRLNIKRLILLLIILLVFALPYINSAIDNLILRNEHDTSKGSIGSGRDLFYSVVFEDFCDSSLFNQLFGHGLYSSLILIKKVLGQAIFAHNGYLDTVYQFGILGLLIFLLCIFKIMKFAKDNYKKQSIYCSLLIYMGVAWLVKSSVSHGYLDLNSLPFSIALAYLVYKMTQILHERKI